MATELVLSLKLKIEVLKSTWHTPLDPPVLPPDDPSPTFLSGIFCLQRALRTPDSQSKRAPLGSYITLSIFLPAFFLPCTRRAREATEGKGLWFCLVVCLTSPQIRRILQICKILSKLSYNPILNGDCDKK